MSICGSAVYSHAPGRKGCRRASEAMTRLRSVVQTLVPLIALVVVSAALTVLGCSSGSDTKFSGATANDLANRAYPFPTGAGAILAQQIGLPQGQAFTLQFGYFGG